jgi:hypothetical protein
MICNDAKFERFNEEEKDMILAIALGDFKIKLEKNDIRNAVKNEIFKTAMRDTTRQRRPWYSEAKNILQYYRFGSSKKKKYRNYLMQLGDRLIYDNYVWEIFGSTIWE